MTEQDLAQVMATVVKAATAPMLADLKALQASIGTWEQRWNDVVALRERVAVVEVRQPIPGPQGAPGLNGERGAPGLDGKDGSDGLNGKDGAAGVNGKDGADGLNGKDGTAGLNGKDGAPGLNGKDGQDGLHGKDGANGMNGQDGIGVMDAMLDRAGQLIVTLSNGQTKAVGVVVGKDGSNGVSGQDGRDVDPLFVQDFLTKELAKWPKPKDGQDGAPGLGVDDLQFGFNKATREITATFVRDGQVVRAAAFALDGLPAYQGVYAAGKSYADGDLVTRDGSLWLALAATKDRPGNGATSWKLIVKAGEKGDRGPAGDPGRPGKDLTQLGPDGSKWGR